MMRAVFVTPGSLGIPTPIDATLAAWAGALKAQGAAVRVRSLDAEAADRLATEGRMRELIALSRGVIRQKRSAGDVVGAAWLETRLDAAESDLLGAEDFKRALRDPSRCADPTTFRRATSGLAAAFAFVHQLEPRFDPRDPSTPRRLIEFVRDDPWTPLGALVDAELLDETLRDAPDLVAIRVDADASAADAFRTAARIKHRAPAIKVVVGGPTVRELIASAGSERVLFDGVDALLLEDSPGAFAACAAALVDGRSSEGVPGVVFRDESAAPSFAALRYDAADDAVVPDFDSAAATPLFVPQPVFGVRLRPTGAERASPERLRNHVVAAADAVGVARWRVDDEPADLDDLACWADAVRTHGRGASWCAVADVEVGFADPDFAARLFEGGLRSLALRMGSASDAVRARRGEPVGVDRLPALFRVLRAAGVSVEPIFDIGPSGESRADVLETVRFLERERTSYGLAVYGGLDPQCGAHVETETDAPNWIPRVGPAYMAREEAFNLNTMLARFDHRPLLRRGLQLPFAVDGPHDGAFGGPFAAPPELIAYCTPYPPEPDAPAAAFAANGDQVVFGDDFGFRRRLEAAFDDIRAEWLALPRSLRIEYRDAGASDGYWAQIGLCGAGMRVPSLRRTAPKLSAALDAVPGAYTAAFSIVGPRTRITPHSGEDRTLLRCHLPIDTPPECGLVVGGVRLPWVDGKTIVFDDTLPHAAWNGSDREKVLLLIDFRPACRVAQGFAPSPEQLARDRAHYIHLFPEWAAEARGEST